MLARRLALLGGLGALAACATGPVPTAELPGYGETVTLDPARQAIIQTAYLFGTPGIMAGKPWEAAQAISEVEFLAVELNYAQRWIEMSPLVKQALVQARSEWRGALAIDLAAPPQAVIDAFTAVRTAYGAQDPAAAAAAVHPPLFTPGGAATIARLAELPPLPQTAWATSMAQTEMWRIQRQGSRGNFWR